MFIGSVRLGKAFVSLHLMPLYMCPGLTAGMSADLQKRMQGKTCFNFRSIPSPELMAEIKQLTDVCLRQWAEKKWL